MIDLVISGIDETIEELDRYAFIVEDMSALMHRVGAELKRVAVDASPVVTGSYRRSHEYKVGDNEVVLQINPKARNSVTGQPVTKYAKEVERRHQVYRMAVSVTEPLVESLWREVYGNQ